MRVDRKQLRQFGRRASPPAPPRVEPLLAAVDEARVIAKADPADPRVAARRDRVLVLLRRPATPEGADAELVALLAAARALPLERREDRLKARRQLADIARLEEPPSEVARLLDRLGIKPGDGQAFADALLPPTRDIGDFYESGAGFLGGSS
jgi:hypothetical protein